MKSGVDAKPLSTEFGLLSSKESQLDSFFKKLPLCTRVVQSQTNYLSLSLFIKETDVNNSSCGPFLLIGLLIGSDRYKTRQLRIEQRAKYSFKSALYILIAQNHNQLVPRLQLLTFLNTNLFCVMTRICTELPETLLNRQIEGPSWQTVFFLNQL